MSNNSTIKYWTNVEEIQLIDEINNLTNIDEILQNHNRKIAGILARIEKILNDPIKLTKIFDKDKIVEKYLSNAKNNLFYNYEELYSNILNFNSLDEISVKYNKLSHLKIKTILNNFLEKKDLDLAKKLRIKCLLKSTDDLDFAKKVLDNKNVKTNTIGITETDKSTEQKQNDFAETINPNNVFDNVNSIMITLLNEIKTMKTDIFDIRNRVKIIMDKVNKMEKNNNSNNNLNIDCIISSSKKNKKFDSFVIDDLIDDNNNKSDDDNNDDDNNDDDNNDDDNNDDNNNDDNSNNGKIIKTKDKKDKKDERDKKDKKKKKEKINKHHHNDIDINKHVEKIMKKNNSDTYDDNSNYDSDELEKELTKIIN